MRQGQLGVCIHVQKNSPRPMKADKGHAAAVSLSVFDAPQQYTSSHMGVFGLHSWDCTRGCAPPPHTA